MDTPTTHHGSPKIPMSRGESWRGHVPPLVYIYSKVTHVSAQSPAATCVSVRGPGECGDRMTVQ